MDATNRILKLRRMTNEPTASVYTDDMLTAYIADAAVMDANGNFPDDDDWVETYDLNRAAADIWEEKIAVVSGEYDFNADGGDYKQSQRRDEFERRARHYRARQQAVTKPVSSQITNDEDYENAFS